MRIKKTTETTPRTSETVNEYSNSTKNAYSCDYTNKRNTYSTDEVFTGKYWIDGKKIYRRVITYENTTTGGRDIATSITNYDYIRVVNWDYHTVTFTLGLFGSTQNGDLINVWLNGNAIHFECASNSFKDGTLYVEIEYTKTTD